MNIIGIVDDTDGSLELVTLYKVLKKFYKTKFLLSYKHIFKNNKFESFKDYLLYLRNNNTEVAIIRLKSSDFNHKDIASTKFNILIFSQIRRYIDVNFIAPNYLVYNYDLFAKHDFIKKYTSPKYSYGISYNADFFPSSIQYDYLTSRIMVCISKNILTLSNNSVVSQEFSLKMNNLDEGIIYNILSALIVFILFDIKLPTILNNLEHIFKEENIHA